MHGNFFSNKKKRLHGNLFLCHGGNFSAAL
uniref:Uncharacterized protein n=1 Tax=Rhizophora mucronata TaxID=61149 RepID=A0A2P2PGU9_RHIMU